MSLPNNLIGIFSTFDFHSDLGGREESFIKLLSFIELYRHSETTEPFTRQTDTVSLALQIPLLDVF